MGANPQKENGFLSISTELYDAMIKFRIPGECEQVFKAIIRKTYGYHKKEDAIANSQLVELTGLKKGNVSRALSKLITNGLVIKSDNNNKNGHILKINKDYQGWIPFVIKSDNKKKKLSEVKPKLSEVITTVIRSDNKSLSEVRDTKDKIYIKDTLQKIGETPAQNARCFFKGVDDLRNGIETQESEATRVFLQIVETKHPNAGKRLIWNEIQRFERYWTEMNATGTKQRWQKQETFQVERRLATWFSKIKEFEKNKINNKYKVGIVQKK